MLQIKKNGIKVEIDRLLSWCLYKQYSCKDGRHRLSLCLGLFYICVYY